MGEYIPLKADWREFIPLRTFFDREPSGYDWRTIQAAQKEKRIRSAFVK